MSRKAELQRQSKKSTIVISSISPALNSNSHNLTATGKLNNKEVIHHDKFHLKSHNRFNTKEFSGLITLTLIGLVFFITSQLADNKQFSNFLNIFLGLSIEALPFLLLGAIAAGTIAEVMQSNIWLKSSWKLKGQSRISAAASGLGLGLILPVCECGTASVAKQVVKEGGSVTLSFIFLLSAPVVNPVTIAVTWIAFNGNIAMVLGRTGLGLTMALFVGLLFSLHPVPQSLFSSVSDKTSGNQIQEHSHSHSEIATSSYSKLTNFFEFVIVEFVQSISAVLPGITAAALFQTYVSQNFFIQLGQGALLSVVALMLLAMLMSVCSSVDAFVALSFANLFPLTSLLAFLVIGPTINLKSIFLLHRVLKWQVIAQVSLLCFLFIMLVTVFLNLHIG